MVWVGVFVALVIAVLAFLRLSGATIYFANPHGYRAVRLAGDNVLAAVSADRFARIIERAVLGDLFDGLHVSLHADPQRGIFVACEEGAIEMSCSFLKIKDSERLAVFREAMNLLGHELFSEHSWNVGMGEALESHTLRYRIAADANLVRETVLQTLDLFEGPATDLIYVKAWRKTDGLEGSRFKVSVPKDPLTHVP